MPVRAHFAVLATMLLAVPSFAQDDEEEYPVDPTLTGPYLGASFGAAWDNFDSRGAKGHFGSSALSSFILGYRGSEYISVEGEFELLDGFEQGDQEIDGWMTSLGFRVHFPIGQIEPYLSYGGGILHMAGRGPTLRRVNATDVAFMAGGGVAYQWTDRFSLFGEAQYTWPISGVDGFDHTTLRFGLLYKFTEE